MSYNIDSPHNNGAAIPVAHIIESVASSAVEVKTRELCLESRQAISAQKLFREMGHKQ